jgi:hypothetical protein
MSQLETIKKVNVPKPETLSVPAALDAKRAEESKLVRGIFRFHEVPGGQMEFMCRKYKGDAIAKYSMKDGEVYEVPLGVARHLNTQCWYPSYAHSDKASQQIAGSAAVVIKEKIRRCSFQSLDFVEQEKKLTENTFN